VLLEDTAFSEVERIVRDSTDMYCGIVVLKASTLLTILRRAETLKEMALKIRPVLRALACTDRDCAELVKKIDAVLPEKT
jgi:hypothetical protein